MPIIFDKKAKSFKLDTPNSSYLIYITAQNFLYHVYYGSKIPESDIRAFMPISEDYVCGTAENGVNAELSAFPFEYAPFGIGNLSEHSFDVYDKTGNKTCDIRYLKHSIYTSKPKLSGLPATFADDSEATTLEILCIDKTTNLEITLLYTVFENLDVIARSVKFCNKSDCELVLGRALSVSVDLPQDDYDLISLPGGWGRERIAERMPIRFGKQILCSREGKTGNSMNNFFAVCKSDTTEDFGEAYGCCLVYSGNYFSGVDKNSYGTVRMFSGIDSECFRWSLLPNECFTTPEALLCYSNKGLGEMSRTYHDLMRKHLIRSKWAKRQRPVLINNWEATYFDFDSDKLLQIAERAARCGIEMLVMDDGWFGRRNNDSTSLGDWFVFEEKLKCTLPELVKKVNALGLKFGIWFEPEMISPDSELYRQHPDWCLHIKDRERHTARRQLVLDLSRKEVRDAVYKMIYDILKSADIEYVKWDHNRSLTEVGNEIYSGAQQMSVSHRYMLGVYEMQERLLNDFPDLLLENCSAGGARFDAGMLYYSPQIWTSDNTDAGDRLPIQEGTSLCYPPLTFGTHISAVPSHLTNRTTLYSARESVALSGTFGFELDITKLDEEYDKIIHDSIALYKEIEPLVTNGDYYRLSEISESKPYYAWEFVSKSKDEVLFEYIRVKSKGSRLNDRVKLKGLNPETVYSYESGKKASGALLMNYGVECAVERGDYMSFVLRLKAIKGTDIKNDK